MSESRSLRTSATALGVVVALAVRADRRGAATMLGLRLLAALANTAFAWFMKLIVDAAVARDLDAATRGAMLVAACIGLAQLGNNLAFRVRIRLEENMSLLIDDELIQLAAGVPGIEHHERPDYLKELELLSQARVSLSQTAGAVFEVAAVLVRGAGTVLLLGGLHPLLLLLPVAAIPSLLAGRRATLLREAALERTAEQSRLGRELFDLATTAPPAKELRLFGLGDELVARHHTAWMTHYDNLLRAQARGAVATTVGWLLFTGGYTAAVVFVAIRAINGALSIGDVYLAMNLAGQVNSQVAQFVATYSWSVSTMKSARRYLWLRDYAAEANRTLQVGTPASAPDRLASGIEFHEVAFRYPDTDQDVLTGVTLSIPAGTTVAFVGENGAGKTTLIKLLCRFYEPTSGTILVDGVDLRRMDIAAWRERISAGFQDFARFEFLAQHVVGVGSLPSLDDDTEVRAALARAGAPDIADQLPDGLATQLGKSFEHGAELSLGQWQQLALGRTKMRTAPLVLILDEPTASLDAQTEHALFERYAETARAIGERTGSITLLVSHRFSTVRMADLIVVIEDGRITEQGSHSQLMARDATYAELYELQARAYR